MDKFTDAERDVLNVLIKHMDKNVAIDRIDYDNERIVLSYKHQTGLEEEWIDHDFYSVNTSMESVPTAMYEVVNAVFHKCVL